MAVPHLTNCGPPQPLRWGLGIGSGLGGSEIRRLEVGTRPCRRGRVTQALGHRLWRRPRPNPPQPPASVSAPKPWPPAPHPMQQPAAQPLQCQAQSPSYKLTTLSKPVPHKTIRGWASGPLTHS